MGIPFIEKIGDFIELLIDTFREVVKKRKEERLNKIDKLERAVIAKVFNDRYTYIKEWVPNMPYIEGVGMFGMQARGGYAWMCPECNVVHHPIELSTFTGLQYPKCCSTSKGHRLYLHIKGGCN